MRFDRIFPASRLFMAKSKDPSRSPSLSTESQDVIEQAEENRLRPRHIGEFVGQNQVVENLRIFIAAARQRGEALDHVLLYGPPGLATQVHQRPHHRAQG
jgi:hypothetical protein